MHSTPESRSHGCICMIKVYSLKFMFNMIRILNNNNNIYFIYTFTANLNFSVIINNSIKVYLPKFLPFEFNNFTIVFTLASIKYCGIIRRDKVLSNQRDE